MDAELRRTGEQTWEIRTLQGEAEIGYGLLKHFPSTGRLLGVERGPALLVEWVTIRKQSGVRRQPVIDLFVAVINAALQISKNHPLIGVVFDPMNPGVNRLTGKWFAKLAEETGVQPDIYLLIPLKRIEAVLRLLEAKRTGL